MSNAKASRQLPQTQPESPQQVLAGAQIAQESVQRASALKGKLASMKAKLEIVSQEKTPEAIDAQNRTKRFISEIEEELKTIEKAAS